MAYQRYKVKFLPYGIDVEADSEQEAYEKAMKFLDEYRPSIDNCEIVCTTYCHSKEEYESIIRGNK